MLKELNSGVVVTKMSLSGEELDRIEDAVVEQMGRCLARLGRDSMEVIYLHNQITKTRENNKMSPSDVAVVTGALL